LVEQAIDNVAEFSRYKAIEIRKAVHESSGVSVRERDVVRAMSNIIHNAIKYTWARRQGESSWITISVDRGGGCVRMEVENYGVPIPKDEIESGYVFRTGTRGRLATDRGRTGTGIGLADARQTAERHGGSVSLASKPARAGAREDDYEQPFLTKATLVLPVAGASR
jgi:signal transduction histidine kinase